MRFRLYILDIEQIIPPIHLYIYFYYLFSVYFHHLINYNKYAH